MAKGPKKRPSGKENEPRTIRIKLTKTGIKDIELAIQQKLKAESTNLFRTTDTLIIILEDEGNRPPPPDDDD